MLLLGGDSIAFPCDLTSGSGFATALKEHTHTHTHIYIYIYIHILGETRNAYRILVRSILENGQYEDGEG
jgi:hypothetical protein